MTLPRNPIAGDSRKVHRMPTPVRYDALYQFPTFFRSLHATVGSRTDLRPLLHVELAKMLTGRGILARVPVVQHRAAALYLTSVTDDLALVDSPIDSPDERRGALLYAAAPEQARDWAIEYDGVPAREIRPDTRTPGSPHNEGPDQLGPGRTSRYRDVLDGATLRRLGVVAAHVEPLLDADFPATPVALGVEKALLDRVNTRFLAALSTAHRAMPAPGVGEAGPIRVTLETLVAQLRVPLGHYLLQLTREQKEVAERPVKRGPYVIRGAAGTGKTLVGLLRMRHLVEQLDLFSDRPLLLTCYNRVLAGTAQQLLPSIIRDERQRALVQVRTVFSLMRDWQRRLDPGWRFQVDDGRLLRTLSEVRAALPTTPLPGWTDQELLEEFYEVIYGRGIRSRSEYRATDRAARGGDRTLTTAECDAVWAAYRAFRIETQRLGLTPWAQVAARLSDVLTRTPLKEATYAGIIIDECQDFTPTMIRVLTQLQAGRTEHLMLLGDPTQTVTQRGFRWADFGLSVAPRNIVTLHRAVRCSHAIIHAALPLARSQRERIGDESLLPDATADDRPPVEIWLCGSLDAERAAIVNRIEALAQSGMQLSNIAVLTESRGFIQRLEEELSRRHIRVERSTADGTRGALDIFDPSVKIIGPSSAKGLEFQVVFLPGITESYYPSVPRPGIDVARRQRALYVAMTRAGHSLILSSRTPGESGLLATLDQRFITRRHFDHATAPRP